MRYSATHNLMFIHIPKCAGMSVLNGLKGTADFPYEAFAQDTNRPISELEGIIFNVFKHGMVHNTLGNIQPTHLPLGFLRDHFPATYTLLDRSTSFAVIRNPRDRFISAIQQRLREFKDFGATSIDDDSIVNEGHKICDFLSKNDEFCDLENIHFTRQVDYIYLDGEQKVDNLFLLEDFNAMQAWLQERFDIRFPADMSRNKSVRPKSWFKPLSRLAMPAYKRLPRRMRDVIRPITINSFLYSPVSRGYRHLSLGEDTEHFIKNYYSDDWSLYHQLAAQSH